MPTPSAPHSSQAISASGSSFSVLTAPVHWQQIDVISDVHLHENEPANFLAWRKYLETTTADALLILGDLFEVWVGDDVLRTDQHMSQRTSQRSTPQDTTTSNEAPLGTTAINSATRHEGIYFEDRCARVLHYAAQRKALYFMHGNRDFLLSSAALQTCGLQLLSDPTVLIFGGVRYLLSHGDALCLGDTEYQAFRAKVRSPQWQNEFLSHPLQERMQMARSMRAQSQARKDQGGPWVDLTPEATTQWMNSAKTLHMVHGHTHEGVDHPITSAQGTGVRHVLCDWHADAQPPRAQVLRMRRAAGSAPGQVSVQRLPVDAATAV